jgi:hypothetical protein
VKSVAYLFLLFNYQLSQLKINHTDRDLDTRQNEKKSAFGRAFSPRLEKTRPEVHKEHLSQSERKNKITENLLVYICNH